MVCQQNQSSSAIPGPTEEDSAWTGPRIRPRPMGLVTSDDVDVGEVDLLQWPGVRPPNFYPG